MPKSIQTITTEKTATLPFLETKERIAAVLNDYLKQSKTGKKSFFFSKLLNISQKNFS
jgi:hypothetical protein